MFGKKELQQEVIYLRSQISDLQEEVRRLNDSHKDALKQLTQEFLDFLKPSRNPLNPPKPALRSFSSIPGFRPQTQPPSLGVGVDYWTYQENLQKLAEASSETGSEPIPPSSLSESEKA